MKLHAFVVVPEKNELEIKRLILCQECKYFDSGEYIKPYDGTCSVWGNHLVKKEWWCSQASKKKEEV
jgi:hypothetical protein